jgi:hypothetical protein
MHLRETQNVHTFRAIAATLILISANQKWKKAISNARKPI